jgi:hypothetical protein
MKMRPVKRINMVGNAKQPKIVGFAGHRHLPDAEGLAKLVREELTSLKQYLGDGLIGISSAAAGADLVFLRTCVDLRIPVIVVLPFPEEKFAKDFEDESDWSMAEKLTGVALAKYVSRHNFEAPEAYQAVSRDLVEWADAFLFAWDGEPPHDPGGTGETVEEARDLGIPTRVIDPATLKAKWTVPLDPARKARHGFDSRADLLDFLDLRFARK